MGYVGAGTNANVRWELADRAKSIGYGDDDASRIMDQAFWLDGAGYGDECNIHPAMRRFANSFPQSGGCEACEVIRQSDAKGWTMGKGGLSYPAETPQVAKAARMAVVHYLGAGYDSNACGRGGNGDSDPRKTTCGGCKRTGRHSRAAYAALKVDTREVFGNAGIREGMLVRHRVSGALGVVRTIDTRCHVGYWGNTAQGMRGADHFIFPTPEVLLALVELITIDDLITVGSTFTYLTNTYTVTAVSGTEVAGRCVGTWRDGRTWTPAEFAADMGNGYLKVQHLAPSGAEGDPIITMIDQARQALIETFPVGAFMLVKRAGRKMLCRVVASTADHLLYTDPLGSGAHEATWAMVAGWVHHGVITVVKAALTESGDVISVTLVPSDSGYRSYESAQVFALSGTPHNRGADYRISAYPGVCCEDEPRIHYHMSAEATVISAHPQAPVSRLSVAVGQVILIDNRPWRIAVKRDGAVRLYACQHDKPEDAEQR